MGNLFFFKLSPSLQSQSKAWLYPTEQRFTQMLLVLTQVSRSSRSSRSIYGHRQTRSCRGQGQPARSQIWSLGPSSHSPAPMGTESRTHGHRVPHAWAPGSASSARSSREHEECAALKDVGWRTEPGKSKRECPSPPWLGVELLCAWQAQAELGGRIQLGAARRDRCCSPSRGKCAPSSSRDVPAEPMSFH